MGGQRAAVSGLSLKADAGKRVLIRWEVVGILTRDPLQQSAQDTCVYSGMFDVQEEERKRGERRRGEEKGERVENREKRERRQRQDRRGADSLLHSARHLDGYLDLHSEIPRR
jgi:hypothetical protein